MRVILISVAIVRSSTVRWTKLLAIGSDAVTMITKCVYAHCVAWKT
jgi:hypothetical protein